MADLQEISELAWSIADENTSLGILNLPQLIERKDIGLIEGEYGDSFLAQLQHCSGNFFIYLNLQKLPGRDHPRTIFSIAHELGHFFIDSHRNKLEEGISLTYSKSNSILNNVQIEKEANHFASHLLMPQPQFLRLAATFPYGITNILELKSIFSTSFESTAIHYIKLDVNPCILIKWNADLSIKYYLSSDSFYKKTTLLPNYVLKTEKNKIRATFNLIVETQAPNDMSENVTRLSSWVGSVSPASKREMLGLEQTIKMAEFGGFTLLTFN